MGSLQIRCWQVIFGKGNLMEMTERHPPHWDHIERYVSWSLASLILSLFPNPAPYWGFLLDLASSVSFMGLLAFPLSLKH